MKTDVIDFNFVSYSAYEIIYFAEYISSKMKSNSRFSNLKTMIEELDFNIITLLNYSLVSKTTDPQDSAALFQTKEEIIEILKILAKYVCRIAENDESIITMSGFQLEHK